MLLLSGNDTKVFKQGNIMENMVKLFRDKKKRRMGLVAAVLLAGASGVVCYNIGKYKTWREQNRAGMNSAVIGERNIFDAVSDEFRCIAEYLRRNDVKGTYDEEIIIDVEENEQEENEPDYVGSDVHLL